MENKVCNLRIDLDWELIGLISELDRFDGAWELLEKQEGRGLDHLKNVATIQSVGASTRIEGSKMGDREVSIFLENLEIKKAEDRDSQEVLGYFNVLSLIWLSYHDIRISETDIKGLHNQLMRESEKDEWHRGGYKQHSNAVEAILPTGERKVIFNTTPAGFETDEAMRKLIDWYHSDKKTHPLVKCAVFTYEFLSIHPFQDGNGRLSRLISTLLLLKSGYVWVQYVSFEKEIEERKKEYYQELQKCQSRRPNENITSWVKFFFDALKNIQNKLEGKLNRTKKIEELSSKEKEIFVFICENGGLASSSIGKKLGIPLTTLRRQIETLLNRGLVRKEGKARGTVYWGN